MAASSRADRPNAIAARRSMGFVASLIDSDLAATVRVTRSAEHTFGGELENQLAAGVDRDQPAVAAEAAQLIVQELVDGLRERETAILDRRADVVSRHGANEVLPVPGGRYRAYAVLGVGSGADDRRIADPPRPLVRHTAGRGGGGEIALDIECYRADRARAAHCAHTADRARRSRRSRRDQLRNVLAALLELELLDALGGSEVAIRHQREAFLERELFGPGADQQHVPRLLHDAAGEVDGISHVPYRSHGAGAHLPAVHDGSIELGRAVAGECRAMAGIEERVVLEDAHRRADRVETAAPALEDGKPRIEGGREPRAKTLLVLGRERRAWHRAGAAVNRDGVHAGCCRPSGGHRRTWRSRAARVNRVPRGTYRRC